MSSLRELQCGFMREIFDAENTAFESSIASKKLPATRSLGIYRNNIHSTLHGALRDVYPVVERLVGESFFRRMAHDYLVQHPSPSGDLHDFGATFADFIGTYSAATELVYLADTARVEWLYHRLFHAAEHAALDIARLAAIAEAHHAELKFCLHPASALLTSFYPVDRIWEVNQPDYCGDDTLKLEKGNVYLLLKRTGFTITMERLARGEFVLLEQLLKKADFSTACEVAMDNDPQVDLGVFMQRMIAAAVIVDFVEVK